MTFILKEAFDLYPAAGAPFLHRQYHEWEQSKPFSGMRIAQHYPVTQNALLKLACLVVGGADLTVTNPDFMKPCPLSLAALQREDIRFEPDMQSLMGEQFDIYLDCGATLYRTLGAPKIGAVEITGTGDHLYRQLSVTTPVISIDRSYTKQLETIGVGISMKDAFAALTTRSVHRKAWLVFGFGKIGRGIAYLCEQNGYDITVVDIRADVIEQAKKLNIKALAGDDLDAIKQALMSVDVVITATGCDDVLSAYPKSWFDNKVLANMGILDEFGPRFSTQEVLYQKNPINFVLNDPTPIAYIDPEMYAHNQVALNLLNRQVSVGVHNMTPDFDNEMISQWCRYHGKTREEIERWFIQFSDD